MKKRLSGAWLFVCLLLALASPAAFASGTHSGTCGDNLTWTLDANGKLTIGGVGAVMDCADGNRAPWHDYKEKIVSVVFEKGVTNTGRQSFIDCVNLTGVSLPDTLTAIDAGSFQNCSKLVNVAIPKSVTAICGGAFMECSCLSAMAIPANVSLIDESAFRNCCKLKSVSIPKTVTEIAPCAFEDCPALENAYYAGSKSEWRKVKIGERNDSLSAAVKFNVPTYAVAVVVANDQGSVAYGSREWLAHEPITVTPPAPPKGYRFKEWGGLSAVTVAEGGAETARVTFDMPAKNVTLTAQYVPGFDDVSEGAYFYNPVYWAVDRGITNGTTKTTFSPGNICTTANILTFLWRANQSPEPSAIRPFSNVDESAYYAKAAAWAYEKGMISGNTFDANAPCTRAATMRYLWILAGRPKSGSLPFTDVDANADYAWAIAWAVERDITKGTTDTTFSPDNACTRGQIVTFLYRHYAQ